MQEAGQGHHKEHDVENHAVPVQTGGSGIGGQDDGNRTLQAAPGDKQPVPCGELEEEGAQPHRQRAGHKNQHGGQNQAGAPDAHHALGHHQQSQQEEDHHVGKGGDAGDKVAQSPLEHELAVAHPEAGEEDGYSTVGLDEVRHAED